MLESDQRHTFGALADLLIPAADPMPSASSAGVPDALIDKVLAFRPDLVEPFTAALATAAGKDPAQALDELSERRPEQFEALTLLTAGAYFQSTKVKQALAYDPPPRAAHDDTDTYVDMLISVVERGFEIR